ncbi:MAG: lipopolysaccharide biosynthesis protein [Ottowia sp.]|nr:lipopolysaccharide biosynthesis protein [Ottowia sp.]
MNHRQILGFAVGPVAAGGLSALSLPVMTWIFPAEAIGQLSMLQVAINFAIILSCLGLDQAYVREYHETEDKPNLLLNAALPGLAILFLMLLTILLIAPESLSAILYDEKHVQFSILTAACIMVAYVSRFLSLVLRMQNRGLAYSMSQILAKLLLLAIIVIYAFATTKRGFSMLLGAQAAALTLTLIVFSWNTRYDWLQALHARLHSSTFKHLFAFGWPLIFGGVASWGLAAMARLFLRSYSSFEELAFYSVASSIASAATVMAGIFNVIWSPIVFQWVANNENLERINTIAYHMTTIVFISLCFVAAISPVIQYILPLSYNGVQFLIVGCMAAPLYYTLAEVTGIGISVTRRTVFALMAAVSAVIVNAVLCLLLVSNYGATGAMIANVTAFWVYWILRTEFSALIWNKLYRCPLHIYAIGIWVLSVIVGVSGYKSNIEIRIVLWIVSIASLWHGRRSLHAIWQLATQRH